MSGVEQLSGTVFRRKSRPAPGLTSSLSGLATSAVAWLFLELGHREEGVGEEVLHCAEETTLIALPCFASDPVLDLSAIQTGQARDRARPLWQLLAAC